MQRTKMKSDITANLLVQRVLVEFYFTNISNELLQIRNLTILSSNVWLIITLYCEFK